MEEKFTLLREWMLKNGFFALLIPRTDEFQNEYISPSSERIKWLTGFSGSAGEVLVMIDRAFLFVDGRYTLQAEKETNSKLITVIQSQGAQVEDFFYSALPNGSVVGYNPWLYTQAHIERIKKISEKNNVIFKPTPYDPIDYLWTDKPKNESSWAVHFPDKYSGMSSTNKIVDIASSLGVDNDDLLFISDLPSIAWLLNIRGNDTQYIPIVQSFVLLYKSGSLQWFVDENKITDSLRQKLSSLVEIISIKTFPNFLEVIGHQTLRVQLDKKQCSSWIYEKLQSTGAIIHDKENPCIIKKACKNQTERNGAVNAHIKDGIAVCKFLAWFDEITKKNEIYELDAAKKIYEFRSENPLFRGESFSCIAASAENAAIVHYHTDEQNNSKIKNNSLFLIDSGAQYLDGTTDITRTIAVGDVGLLEKKRYTQVLKGHIAIATIAFPEGTSGSQIDALARQYLWRDGVDYTHGTGHGIGSYLSVHEGPQRISSKGSNLSLAPGMLISNEPGYYLANSFGIRLENVVMVEPMQPVMGSELKMLKLSTLTLVPFDRRLIDKSLLTLRERSWIDGYHSRIKKLISPFVDKKTALWLEWACAPL